MHGKPRKELPRKSNRSISTLPRRSISTFVEGSNGITNRHKSLGWFIQTFVRPKKSNRNTNAATNATESETDTGASDIDDDFEKYLNDLEYLSTSSKPSINTRLRGNNVDTI